MQMAQTSTFTTTTNLGSGSKDSNNIYLQYLQSQIHHRLVHELSQLNKLPSNPQNLQNIIETQLNDNQTVHVVQKQVLRTLKQEYSDALKHGREVVHIPVDLYDYQHKPHLIHETVWQNIIEWIITNHRMGSTDVAHDVFEALTSIMPKDEMNQTLFEINQRDRPAKLLELLSLTRGIRIFKSFLKQLPIPGGLESDLQAIYDKCKSGVAKNSTVFPLFHAVSRKYVIVEYEAIIKLLDVMIANLNAMGITVSNGTNVAPADTLRSAITSSFSTLTQIDNLSVAGVQVQTDTHPPGGFPVWTARKQVIKVTSESAASSPIQQRRQSQPSSNTVTTSNQDTKPQTNEPPLIGDLIPAEQERHVYSEWEYRADAIKKAKMANMRNAVTQSTETTFKREVEVQCWVQGKTNVAQTMRNSSCTPNRTVRAPNGQVLTFSI